LGVLNLQTQRGVGHVTARDRGGVGIGVQHQLVGTVSNRVRVKLKPLPTAHTDTHTQRERERKRE
jgi:hypothetical protein